jgi:hypothetical protein
MFKSRISRPHRIPDFQKSRVTGPWDHKVSVSTKKVKKKCSSLCTFNHAIGIICLNFTNYINVQPTNLDVSITQSRLSLEVGRLRHRPKLVNWNKKIKEKGKIRSTSFCYQSLEAKSTLLVNYRTWYLMLFNLTYTTCTVLYGTITVYRC